MPPAATRYIALSLVSMFAMSAHAQSLSFALDLYYSDPTDTNSAGVWELLVLSSDRGLAGANVRLAGIMPGAMLMAPTGSATNLPEVGFRENFGPISFAMDNGDHTALLFAQVQNAAPNPQGLLYDVGVPGGATQPGENGTPAIAGLSGTNMPWNYRDLLGDFKDDGVKNNSGAFENGALLALGMFAAGAAPDFYSLEATAGNVFTQLGAADAPPPTESILEATISTTVRDNTGILAGDANFDGTVDGQDFITWNSFKFSNTAGYRNGDFNGDKTVDGQDFIIWNTNKFMSVDGVTVPEPRMAWLWTAAFSLPALRIRR